MNINHGIMNIGNEQLPKNEDIEPPHSKNTNTNTKRTKTLNHRKTLKTHSGTKAKIQIHKERRH